MADRKTTIVTLELTFIENSNVGIDEVTLAELIKTVFGVDDVNVTKKQIFESN